MRPSCERCGVSCRQANLWHTVIGMLCYQCYWKEVGEAPVEDCLSSLRELGLLEPCESGVAA